MPKLGTVTPILRIFDIAKAREFYVGFLGFDEEKLAANATAFVEQIRAVKPAGVKGHYVKSITLSATMSPGVPVSM